MYLTHIVTFRAVRGRVIKLLLYSTIQFIHNMLFYQLIVILQLAIDFVVQFYL